MLLGDFFEIIAGGGVGSSGNIEDLEIFAIPGRTQKFGAIPTLCI